MEFYQTYYPAVYFKWENIFPLFAQYQEMLIIFIIKKLVLNAH